MNAEYLQQTAAAPLFPKILWNRPISRGSAGTLMIVGGHAKEFGLAQASYQIAAAAGSGQCRVILPDSLSKILQGIDDTWFVPSSPSGSIGRGGLGELEHLLQSADGVLIGPNLSSNSETAIVVEKLLGETALPLTVAADAVDALTFHAEAMTKNERCALVIDMPQLFKIAAALSIPLSVRPERGILGRVEIVQQIAEHSRAALICYGPEVIVVHNGRTSVTTTLERVPPDLAYGVFAPFWMQRQGDAFERLTTAAYICAMALSAGDGDDSIKALAKRVEKVLDAY